MRRTLVSCSLFLATLTAAGCPAQVQPGGAVKKEKAQPVVDESDPRVVKEDGDLYSAAALAKNTPEAPEGPNKGSGKPDESNGYCRLYAPKLPEPHCCMSEYGFDAEATAEVCGKGLYLGESFQRSCGYFYLDDDVGAPVWFRTSFSEEPSAKAAAEAYAHQLATRFEADTKVEPVQGVQGAFFTRHEGLAWAWMDAGEWEKVRRLTWRDTSCSDEGIAKVVAQMMAAKPPAKGAQRQGLVPKAR